MNALDRLMIEGEGGRPVVILDAGFASEKNLALLESRGFSYLVNVTRSNRKKYAELFAEEAFETLPGRREDERVEVKHVADPEHPNRCLVLCRSWPRRQKEMAVRKPSLPDAEQEQVYRKLGIDWKAGFKTVRTEVKPTSSL